MKHWEDENGAHEGASGAAGGEAASTAGRYAGFAERADGLTRREVAHTGVSLVFGFGDPLVVQYDGRRPEHVGAFVVGNHTQSALTTYAGNLRGVQVDLTPEGAYALLGIPLDQLTDQVVPVSSLLGRRGDLILDRIASAPSWEERFAVLDRELPAVCEQRHTLAPEVVWLRRQLVAGHGWQRLNALMDETGWSRRHVTRRFREQIGLPPKTFASLLRFEYRMVG